MYLIRSNLTRIIACVRIARTPLNCNSKGGIYDENCLHRRRQPGIYTRSGSDILTFPLLKDATLSLMDINAERLEFAQKSVQRIIDLGHYPGQSGSHHGPREALQGADAVLVTILVGNTNIWRYDIEIPKQYGIDINIGDTRGVSGIFRAMRTIPVMLGSPVIEEILPGCDHA